MNISHSNSQSFDANDLNELQQFQGNLESCVSDGILFFEDLEAALSDLYTNRKLTSQKLAFIRQFFGETMQLSDLRLDWRLYKKL